MRSDAAGRQSVRLVVPCLVLLSAAAPVCGAALEPLTVDTAAVQLSTVAAVQSTEGRRKPRRKRRKHHDEKRSVQPVDTGKIFYDHPWTWGTYGTVACPSTDDLELNQDECRSIALMDLTPDESVAVHVGNPWPVNSANIPRGCSERMGDAVPPLMYYNTHPEGGAHQLYRPVCKEAGYSLYVGGCPAGFVGVDQAECHAACASFKWIAAPTFSFSDAASPKGCYGKAGYYHYNTHEWGTNGDPDAFSVCKVGDIAAVDYSGSSATDSETPHNGTLPNFPDDIVQPLHSASGAASFPTPAPPLPTSTGAVSAVGDPHMTSITGSKFDIARPGNHTLIHIPRHAGREAALISVRAVVKHEGPACLDMYINALHMTGKWADDIFPGGLSFFANRRSQARGHWMPFGKMQLKVVWGRTLSGVKYLNVLAKHLNRVSMPIGGILGLDDHTDAATPESHCRRTMSL